MLVQLRRVVYLLVLLQCCLSVCLANAGKSNDPEANANIAVAESGLRESIDKADEVFLNANACLSVWRKEVESCNNHVSPVKDATDKMDKVVKEIMNKVLIVDGKGVEAPVEIKDDFNEKEVERLLGEATKAIQVTYDAANTAKESITKIRRVEQYCGPYFDKAKQVKEKLEGKNKLEEEDEKKIKEFADHINARDLVDQDVKRAVSTVEERITASVAAMKTAKDGFANVSFALEGRINATKENDVQLKTKFTSINEKIKEVIKTFEGDLTKINETKESVETQKLKDELGKAFEAEVQRLKAEKQSATEQERKEKEQTRGEEGKNPGEEKEEKGAKEQGAQANGGSKEKPQGNAEKETNTTAETNVQTTEAPVKERQEKGETTGDSTQKPGESLNDVSSGTVSNISLQPIISGTSDSSNSPALMHSPLLLLLLCVLGSILVC